MPGPTKKAVRDVALGYFGALARRDADGMAAYWRAGGIERFVGQQDLVAPDGVRGYFAALFAAFPDLDTEVLATAIDGPRCAVQWRMRGTFAGPGAFQGFEPTGARVEFEGCDVVEVEDGVVGANTAYVDQLAIARQLGVMPPPGSGVERRMTALANSRTRMARRLGPREPERVAAGVWLLRGGTPRVMNVYLLEDDGGVTLFDSGIRAMTSSLAEAGARMGGIRRVVLGHAHPDHRGGAAGLRVPVFCHPAERADAEGDAGLHYFETARLEKPHARALMPRLVRWWDGGPVPIAGTLDEGDDVAGFRVIHLPGHAPGQIGLWRESDRLALSSDCFYTLDIQSGRPCPARLPHPATNADTEQARASIRKLAALEPAAAWPGHADPVTGDVRAALERAADSP
jgi:hydroxyacylglutathione hydrolase